MSSGDRYASGPEVATMRGPGMNPASMLLRRSTARNGLGEPTSRTENEAGFESVMASR